MSDEESGRAVRVAPPDRDGRDRVLPARMLRDRMLRVRVLRVRVVLPSHLRTLVGAPREVTLDVESGVADGGRVAVTQRQVLDALEAAYPALGGTLRDRATGCRRPFIRFFACEADLSHEPPDAPLPEPVVQGTEPFIVLGAIAGG